MTRSVKVLGRMINADDDIMLEQTREEQLAAIDKTFTMAGLTSEIRHPVNPNLSIKSVQPLLPDFENWGKDFCQGTFDVDPSSNQVRNRVRATGGVMWQGVLTSRVPCHATGQACYCYRCFASVLICVTGMTVCCGLFAPA